MDEVSLTRLWLMRAGFAALILGLLFFQLLPLETTPRRFAGPDLVMGFAFAWEHLHIQTVTQLCACTCNDACVGVAAV